MQMEQEVMGIMGKSTNYIEITGLTREAETMKGSMLRVYFTSDGTRETLSITNGDESFQFIVSFAPVAELIKVTRKGMTSVGNA